MKYKKLIESHFGMGFEDVIRRLHIEKNRSIASIAREAGVSHTPIVTLAKRLNIKLRNRKDASICNMINNNPAKIPEIREKMSRSMSVHFAKNLLPQEKAFKLFAELFITDITPQYPIGPYVIDFFVPDKNLCIEVDTTRKWGHHKRFKAKEKDEYLISKKYKILRVDKTWALEFLRIYDVLNA